MVSFVKTKAFKGVDERCLLTFIWYKIISFQKTNLYKIWKYMDNNNYMELIAWVNINCYPVFGVTSPECVVWEFYSVPPPRVQVRGGGPGRSRSVVTSSSWSFLLFTRVRGGCLQSCRRCVSSRRFLETLLFVVPVYAHDCTTAGLWKTDKSWQLSPCSVMRCWTCLFDDLWNELPQLCSWRTSPS